MRPRDVSDMVEELGAVYPGRWAHLLILLCGPDCDWSECDAKGKVPHPSGKGWQNAALKRYAERPESGPLRDEHLRRVAHHLCISRGNVGLVIPPGMVALDADVGETWIALVDALDGAYPWQKSANGAHILARIPATVSNIRGTAIGARFGEWPVTLRAPGQQVVAWPSVHRTGFEYDWQVELPQDPQDVPVLDTSLISWHKAPGAGGGATGDNWASILDEVLDVDRVFGPGERHNACVSLAANLAATGADGDLFAAVTSFSDARCDPPLSDREIQGIVDWAMPREEK